MLGQMIEVTALFPARLTAHSHSLTNMAEPTPLTAYQQSYHWRVSRSGRRGRVRSLVDHVARLRRFTNRACGGWEE